MCADRALETIFPLLLVVRSAFFKPPEVFSLRPENTTTFAILPFATLLTFITRIGFFFITAFIAPFDFIEGFIAFITAFIAAFIGALIGSAIFYAKGVCESRAELGRCSEPTY
mmetsp:Transcript_79078/g.221721  ORF Transcript_79078/g.221721 Transcript_79078/m.221721 type:complete len:113 (-) Transcript_79078:26-364(-)